MDLSSRCLNGLDLFKLVQLGKGGGTMMIGQARPATAVRASDDGFSNYRYRGVCALELASRRNPRKITIPKTVNE